MAEEHTTIKINGLDLVYHPRFYNTSRSAEIFENLQELQFNSDEQSQIQIFGKWINIPRKQVAFGNPNLSYKFSGNEVVAKEWPEFLLEIRNELQQYLVDCEILQSDTKHQINYVLVNLYRDGHDYIGAHSDDEKDLNLIYDTNPEGESIILSLSFGATRDFIFHSKSSSATYPMTLKHGDLVIMRGETQ